MASHLEGCEYHAEEQNGAGQIMRMELGMSQTERERPIEQAPEWVRAIMTPTDELVPLREEALRYLVGEPTTQVAPVDDIDALFADDDGRGAA